MWEDDSSWSRVTSSVGSIFDGLSSTQASSLLSPSPTLSDYSSAAEPISPLSCLSTGSPYSFASSSSPSGSMSPDTTSPGILSDSSESSGDSFSKGIYFAQGGSIWTGVGTGGALPSLHEWRKIDQQKRNALRFIFPDASIHHQLQNGSGINSDNVGFEVINIPVITKTEHLECTVSSSSSPTRNQNGYCQNKVTKLCPLSVGKRAEKFMKSFTSSTNVGVNGNLMLVSSEKPFECMWIDCRSSFLQKDCLIDHIDRAHIQTRKDDFSCFWHGCVRRNRPFNARYKLLIHMRVHTGHKPNKCTIQGCDKAFSRLENLKIHLRSHTGERPYICPHCPKAFSNSSDRAKHQRTHFDSKPYACVHPNCDKRYTDPSSLRKHAKMHYLPVGKSIKKENHQKDCVRSNSGSITCSGGSNKNRRKYLGGNGVSSAPTVELSVDIKPNLGPVSNMISSAVGLLGTSSVPSKSQLLNLDQDPPLNEWLSYSNLNDSFSLTPPQHCKNEVDPSVDLDAIPLGDLNWISNMNFDHFDIDCLL
ncbi:unnamed protein product [Orchesella dallaii]|uniref:C2H2-type domain-containing protein n=1 Tax=Orchesella dallaii TaxID=48710 RepID=A0ABP1S272_9HEXA